LAHATAEDLRALIGTLRRRLREEARAGDFTPSQIQVLHLLERDGPATVAGLARALDVRPQSMGETLTVLKAAGAVSGAPDPNDGRQTVLSLTPAFRQKVKASRAAREDWLYRAIRVVSPLPNSSNSQPASSFSSGWSRRNVNTIDP
jgi:DNA-binding MarR family transcriptional regulator